MISTSDMTYDLKMQSLARITEVTLLVYWITKPSVLRRKMTDLINTVKCYPYHFTHVFMVRLINIKYIYKHIQLCTVSQHNAIL